VGFPIRKSADQSSFAAPRGLSQRSTSFIASQRQGIHQTPLRHLIALIINARSRDQVSGIRYRGRKRVRFPMPEILIADTWSALTERPACFEIDPKGARSSNALDVDRGDLRRSDFFGSIPSSRCQTTRVRRTSAGLGRDVRRTRKISLGRASIRWWSQTGSNRRPPACKAGALPTELWPLSEIGHQ
jgi:hypothetical protein